MSFGNEQLVNYFMKMTGVNLDGKSVRVRACVIEYKSYADLIMVIDFIMLIKVDRGWNTF